jgi:hypothetical protein
MAILKSKSGETIEPGSKVKDFHDKEWTFDRISRLPAGNSTGRVQLSRPCSHSENDHATRIHWCRGTEVRDFFPSVVDAQITP